MWCFCGVYNNALLVGLKKTNQNSRRSAAYGVVDSYEAFVHDCEYLGAQVPFELIFISISRFCNRKIAKMGYNIQLDWQPSYRSLYLIYPTIFAKSTLSM